MIIDKMLQRKWEYSFFVLLNIGIWLIPEAYFSFETLFTQTFITSVIAVSSTLFGFILTGVTLLLALPETRKIVFVKKSPQYANVYRLYFKSIKWLALTTLFSFVILFTISNIACAIFATLLVYSFVYTAASVWTMKELVLLLAAR